MSKIKFYPEEGPDRLIIRFFDEKNHQNGYIKVGVKKENIESIDFDPKLFKRLESIP